MAVAETLYGYLKDRGSDYTLLGHPHTGSSMETAEAAKIPGDALAKAVLLKDSTGLLLVVVPSDYHVELDALNRILDRKLTFAPESDLALAFADCEPGAAPPIGTAYGIKTIWDPQSSLGQQTYIYFEAGDHATLVRVSSAHFHALMAAAEQAHFSHHI